MKGLFRKDIYVLTSIGWLFILMDVFFAAIPDLRFYAFAALYAVMLLVFLMQSDEQYKWDTLLPMLPVSTRQVVLEKYIFCWGYIALTALLAVGGQLIWSRFGYMPLGPEYFTVLCFNLSLALVAQAIISPLIFRFGTAKGRLIMIVLVAVITGISVSIISDGYDFILSLIEIIRSWRLIVFAAALSVLSLPLSVALYGRKLSK